jgi:hypothetical protein
MLCEKEAQKSNSRFSISLSHHRERMYKLFLLVLLSVFISVAAVAQVVTDCQSEGLKGNVKTLLSEGAVLEGKPGKWKELRRGRSSTTTWDKQGYETEYIMWASDRPFMKRVSSYDAKQNIRTEKRYDLYKNDSNAPRGFPLDAQGNPMAMPRPAPAKTQEPDVVIHEILYKFDNAGNLSEQLIYEVQRSSKKFYERRVYIWDTDGKQKEEQRYDGTGKVTIKFVYKYDPQGNELESLVIKGKDKITSRTTYSDYQFDSQGNWISRINHEDYLNSIDMRIKNTTISYRQFTYWQ